MVHETEIYESGLAVWLLSALTQYVRRGALVYVLDHFSLKRMHSYR